MWCAIFQVIGQHLIENCHILHKFVPTTKQLFCNFCKSVGHDERHCRSYELIMDKTHTYRMQVESWA